MDYDKLITKHAGEESLDYGIIFGNEKIVFIKSGAGGSITGEDNKYLLMAKRVNARLGATVICASNPDAKHSFLDEKIIKKVAEVKAFANYEVYFVGNSDGAYKVLKLAKNTPEAVGLLTINASMKGLAEFKDILRSLDAANKTLVYGSEDDLAELLPELRELENDRLKIITVEGANHEFSGKSEEFISLIDLL